jgi:nucleoside-diphosphate-sugar epimerase
VPNKILIIGGTGYLGRLLVSALKLQNFKVFTAGTSNLSDFQIDILNIESLNNLFKNNKFDIIFNLSGYGLNSEQKSISRFEVNSKGPRILAESAIYYLPDVHLIHTSTILDSSVNNLFESDYAKSKSMGSKCIENFMHRFPSNFSILRLNNVYGATQPKSRLFRGIVSSIIEKKEIFVQFPNRTRDFCLDLDVVNAIVEILLQNKNLGTSTEVGTGSPISVQSFATEIFSQLDGDLGLLKFNTLVEDVFEKVPDRESGILFKKCGTDFVTGIDMALKRL